jgi:hypothetical protein
MNSSFGCEETVWNILGVFLDSGHIRFTVCIECLLIFLGIFGRNTRVCVHLCVRARAAFVSIDFW